MVGTCSRCFCAVLCVFCTHTALAVRLQRGVVGRTAVACLLSCSLAVACRCKAVALCVFTFHVTFTCSVKGVSAGQAVTASLDSCHGQGARGHERVAQSAS